MIDELGNLLFAFFGKHCCRAFLHGIRGAVEFGGVAAGPELMDRDRRAVFGTTRYRFRNYHVSAAYTGEATVFRERAELDRATASAFYFVDGMRDLRILNEGLVGGIEKDDRIVFPCVGDPLSELCAGGDGTGRVVRKAEINESARSDGTPATNSFSALQGR